MKKIIALTLVLVLCFGLVACGGDTSGIGGKKEPYESAINELRELLDSSYTASELSNPEFHPNFSNPS